MEKLLTIKIRKNRLSGNKDWLMRVTSVDFKNREFIGEWLEYDKSYNFPEMGLESRP